MSNNHTQLILGGVRSGKSAHALAIAEAIAAKRHCFIATAQAFDDEMTARIEQHQEDRGDRWETIETQTALADIIRTECHEDTVCLIDCLTLWLSNLMLQEVDITSAMDELFDATSEATGSLVFVSNEVGMGLVPETPLGRQFRDEHGRLNQRMAAICSRVEFITAGLPMVLKG